MPVHKEVVHEASQACAATTRALTPVSTVGWMIGAKLGMGSFNYVLRAIPLRTSQVALASVKRCALGACVCQALMSRYEELIAELSSATNDSRWVECENSQPTQRPGAPGSRNGDFMRDYRE